MSKFIKIVLLKSLKTTLEKFTKSQNLTPKNLQRHQIHTHENQQNLKR